MPEEEPEVTETPEEGGEQEAKPERKPAEERTFSQADIDRAVKERLAKERSKLGDLNELRRKAGEFDRLAEANKTEMEKLSDKAAAETERAAAAELRALRLEVAHEKGLNSKQAKRLVGVTREELESDADDLLTDFKPEDKPAKPASQRPKESLRTVPLATSGDVEKTDMDAWMRSKASS
jgi:hypothetical protein